MNHHSITTEDYNAIVSIIGYLHDKIREKSRMQGTSLDLVSEEMIHHLGAFIEIQPERLQLEPVRTETLIVQDTGQK